MTDMEMRNRIKVAALKYADVILNRPLDTAGINGQRAWAKNCQQQPDMTAQQLQPAVVMDGAVQTAGKDVTDEALQAAVETTVNRSF
jgi:hypothetical protein